MRKLAVLFTVLIISAVSVQAGVLTIGTRASFYQPPEKGAETTLMVGITATYRFSEYFTLQAGVDHSSYSAGGVSYTLTPITLTAIAHPMPYGNIDPYIGAGVGHYEKTADGTQSSTTGLNGVLGVNFYIGNLTAAFEIRGMIPDTRYMEAGFVTYGGHMSSTSVYFIL